MHFAIILLFLLVIIAIVYTYVNLIDVHHEEVRYPIAVFDNTGVPLIEPPSEIIIEGNTHECHKTLTPCSTHSDCNLCREGLANCQLFDEDTIIKMRGDDGQEHETLIRAGESYCLALDRERARSCNPNTGVWLLAETETGFALLCSCLRPGLVTQLNMYEDCNVPVGCAPHGRIDNINSASIRCVCDDGYVSDYNTDTETPYCRPRTVRDVMHDESFFPRAPCADGQVRLDHPGLNDFYRRHFRLEDICVIDPCSVDPISGQRTRGRLFHHPIDKGVNGINGCNCPVSDLLLPVFNRHTAETGMIRQSDRTVANACLRPFSVHMLRLRRVDYKYFWGRRDHTEFSDADVVFQTNANQLSHERYQAILYPLLGSTEIVPAGTGVMKISVSYDTTLKDMRLPFSIFRIFRLKESSTSRSSCFFPGVGRCILADPDACIRRHGGFFVWTAETFTNSWCILSREDTHIKIWSSASRYPRGDAPAVLRLRDFFLDDRREQNTIRTITTGAMTQGQQIDALTQILQTYPNYSL